MKQEDYKSIEKKLSRFKKDQIGISEMMGDIQMIIARYEEIGYRKGYNDHKDYPEGSTVPGYLVNSDRHDYQTCQCLYCLFNRGFNQRRIKK